MLPYTLWGPCMYTNYHSWSYMFWAVQWICVSVSCCFHNQDWLKSYPGCILWQTAVQPSLYVICLLVPLFTSWLPAFDFSLQYVCSFFIRVMWPLMLSYLACLFYCFTSSFYQQPLQDIYIWLLWLPWILYIQFFCMSKLSIQLSTCSFSMFLAIK